MDLTLPLCRERDWGLVPLVSPSRSKATHRVQEVRNQATGRGSILRTCPEVKEGFLGHYLKKQNVGEKTLSLPSFPSLRGTFPKHLLTHSGRGLIDMGVGGGLLWPNTGKDWCAPHLPSSGRFTMHISIAKAPDKENVWLCLLWGLSALPGA